MTQEDFRSMGRRLSNWGRWGPEDEQGTMNLITPDHIVAASRLIRKGNVFDLSIPLDARGPQNGSDRINPIRLMTETGADQVFPGGFRYADDYVFMALQAGTQWDGLAHVFYDGQLYNGYSAATINVHGALRNSIDKMARGMIGRGVLLDMARHHNAEWLPKGYAISPEDLETCARSAGVNVKAGDILMIRTGWRNLFVSTGSADRFMEGEPGLALSCAPWLREHDVAAVACDNWALDVLPQQNPDADFELHMVLIRDMGLSIGEMFDFEELADDCAADGVYEMFVCAPPLKFTGAVGSPVNPIAIK